MKKTYHMACNIDGLLRNTKGKKITFLEDDNGRQLSDKEARQFLDECKQKGWKLFGSSECEGFDPFGGGCPGHEIIEEEIEKTELPIDAEEQPTPSPQMLLFQ